MSTGFTTIRLAIGLSLLSIVLLLGARWMGLVPDRWMDARAGRRALCEAVALRCAAIANSGEVPQLQARLNAVVDLNPDLISAIVRSTDGQPLVQAGETVDLHPNVPADDLSSQPITAGNHTLGVLEMRFRPLAGQGWWSYVFHPLPWLLALSTVLNVLVSVVVVHALPRASREALRRQNKDLRLLAARDHLTSCLNRRRLSERLESSWKTAKRYGFPLSCVMLDIDHFKSVNDRHGHAVGDEVIRQVAATLQAAVRDSDVVGRYGGDEFCILLPHLELDGACQAAGRYRQLIESLEFPGLQVTLSLGISSSTLGARSSQELVEQADQALYAAKARGRNRVANWEVVAANVEPALAAS